MTITTGILLACIVLLLITHGLLLWVNSIGRKTLVTTVNQLVEERIRRAEESERADVAENKLAAVDVRDSHYPALQEANKSWVALIVGMKDHLQTSNQAPYGRYTARFDKLEDLALFLMFDEDPKNFRRSKQ